MTHSTLPPAAAIMNDHADVSARLKVSRSTVFALWKSGQLGSVKIGKRRFSTDRQITEYVARLEAGAA